MRTIYLCAGHGPDTAGKRTPVFTKGPYEGEQIKEFKFNSKVADKFHRLALARGFKVVPVYSNTKDTPLSIRSKTANNHYKTHVNDRTKALYVSFHFNAYDGKWGTNGGGNETHHYPGSTQGMQAAQMIQSAIALMSDYSGKPMTNRGVKASNFYVLRETLMPAVLIEAGFMDVYNEAMLMLDEDFTYSVAARTLNAIEGYFDKVDPDGVIDNLEDTQTGLKNQILALESSNQNLRALCESQARKLDEAKDLANQLVKLLN